MTGEPRHHHYLPQCYLRGFARLDSNKDQIWVIDHERRKCFSTNVRNIAGLRDFNRIDAEGVDPMILERELSQVESDIAEAIREVESSGQFKGDTKEFILILIAMMSIRHPELRRQFAEFEERVAKSIVAQMVATKERWESLQAQAKKDGKSIEGNVTYEDIKKFHDDDAYTVEFGREHAIGLEMKGVSTVLPLLMKRNYSLLHTEGKLYPFLTSEDPVCLRWQDPESVPAMLRQGRPGFGMNGTQLIFPLTKNIAILGEFDTKLHSRMATRKEVALINTASIQLSGTQLYSATMDCEYIKADDSLEQLHVLAAKLQKPD